MDYTSDEILAATTKLVADAVRRGYGDLGNRDTSITLSDTADAAAGVFLLFPSAPYYVVDLGTQRLQDLVASVAETLEKLYNAVTDIGRNTRPIDSISSLNNAEVALRSLATAARTRATSSGNTSTSTESGGDGSRSQSGPSFTDIEGTPAWQRFDANVQRFLDEHAGNIKSGSSIVDTPAAARSSIPSLLSSVKEGHAELLRRATLLKDAVGDFESLQLRATLSASILERAQEVLGENIGVLESLTPEQRLGELRGLVLDLLAARTLVRNFGSLTPPTLFALIDGVGSPYADAAHPATSASVNTTYYYSPYIILDDSNQLDFFLDGDSSPVTVGIQGSFLARLDGLISEPFDIGVTNNVFDIDVTDASSVNVVLTTGATVPIETVVSDINTAIAAVGTPPPIVAEAYLNPLKFTGNATAGSSPTRFTFLNASVSPAALGIELGDKIVVTSGTNSGNIYTVNFIIEPIPPSTPGVLRATLVSGSHVVATDDVIEVGAPNRLLRIRLTDTSPVSSLLINRRIDLPDTNDIAVAALQTLGYQGSVGIASRRTTADEVINSLDSSPSTVVGLTPRVSASKYFDPLFVPTSQGRTDINSSLKYIIFDLRDVASSVVTSGGVTTITVPDTSNISVGETAVMREADGANDVNAYGLVASIPSSTTFTVTTWSSDDPLFTGPAPADSTDVVVEVGPDLSFIPRDCILKIDENGLVDGDYTVSYSGAFPNSIPFELPLTRALPLVVTGGQPIVSTVSLGVERITFSSTDTTLATKVICNDGDIGSGPNPVTAVYRFFPSGLAEGVGSTTWFKIPEDPKTLETSDLLEFYENDYNIVSQSFVIKSFQLGDLLIELESAMDTDLPSFTFTTEGTTPPFARIRKTKKNNFDSFKRNIETWLTRDENDDTFFRELDALINPLLSNSNPSIVQINNAKMKVQELLGIISTTGAVSAGNPIGTDIEAVLNSYQADVVKQVDVLIDTFQERSADRAVDLLLEGQFTTFFGLDIDGCSYAGDVMKRVQEIQRTDLPVKKVRRPDAGFDRVIAQYEEADFEFDQSDIEGNEEVDIPTDFKKPFPDGAY